MGRRKINQPNLEKNIGVKREYQPRTEKKRERGENIFMVLMKKLACMHEMEIIRERKGGIFECNKEMLQQKNGSNIFEHKEVAPRTYYEYDYYLLICKKCGKIVTTKLG